MIPRPFASAFRALLGAVVKVMLRLVISFGANVREGRRELVWIDTATSG